MMELPNKFFADEDAKKILLWAKLFCWSEWHQSGQKLVGLAHQLNDASKNSTLHSAHGVRCHTVHSAHQLDDAAESFASKNSAHGVQCHSAQCTMLQCQSAQHTIAQDSTQYNTQDSVLCSVEDSAQYSTHSTTQYYTVLHSAQCSTQCTVYTHSAQCRVWHNSENCTFAARTCQALIATCSDHVIKETNKIFEQCQ